MNIRHHIFSLLLGLLLCTCAPSPKNQTAEEPDPPNILFILTDDQGIGDLSLHGNDSIRTPNMDALLRSGARFERFYVSPVCAPTRASFLSGMYAPRTGAVFVTRRRETMADGITTIPEYLRHAGYRTGLFGKWHNGATAPYDPAGQGFDQFLGFTLGHFNDYFNGELQNENNELVPFSGDLTRILTDTAAAFMLEDRATPFFCMLAYQAPHTPVQVADKYWEAVKKRGLTDYNTGIYAMIESIDDRIGQLLDRLEKSGILDNTIVIFSTDNGPYGDRYRMGLKGTKGQVDEGSVRVPFGIKLPGVHHMNGKTVEFPAAHIDLLPTLLDYVGLTVPDNIDGKSLRPLLELTGAGSSPGDPVDSMLRSFAFRNIFTFKQGYDFKAYPGSMRNASYLYVLRGKDQHELYALRRDTAQEHNLFLNRPVKSVDDQDWTIEDLDASRSRQMAAEYAAFAASVARPDRIAPPINLDAARGPVRLLAHEGEPLGRTHFNDANGWANDWFVDLDRDGARWPVETTKDRTYSVTIKYHAGQPVRLGLRVDDLAGEAVFIDLARALTEQLPVADRVRRKEVYPRKWRTARLENLVVPAGSREVRVFAEVAGGRESGFWVKEIILTKI